MFNFTTNVIINDASQFEKVTDSATGYSAFRVKRYRDFKIGDPTEVVKGVYKAIGYNEVLSSVVIKPAAFTALIDSKGNNTVGRITLYVKLQGSNNPLYANDWVIKGKPFSVEFPIKATAAATIDSLIKRIEKMQAMLLNDNIVNVSKDGVNLKIDAVNEYQKICNVELDVLNDETTGTHPYAPEFTKVAGTDTMTTIDPRTGTARDAIYFDADGELTTTEASGNITVAQGIEGFGTYRHLSKDYRLPTQANMRWLKIDEDNYPIKGKVYNQYTIKVETDRGITGQSVVGQPGTSITTHIFWVDNTLASSFEAGLKELGWSGVTNPGIPASTPVATGDDKIVDDTELKTAKK